MCSFRPGTTSGLDADACRAVAVAALGDAAKVQYVPLTAVQRLPAPTSAEIDMLARNTTNYYGGTICVQPGAECGRPCLLLELVSKEPLSVAVRYGDDRWANIVLWSIWAIVEGKKLGLTRANIAPVVAGWWPADCTGTAPGAQHPPP